jgi:acyl-[acyl carrier protein]--UDP-N-acetylglucosamine O-acyltransferase
MTLTIALWPGATSGYASLDLLGKPVWQRTLSAARGLGARKTLWIRENGRSAPDVPDGIDVVHPRELSSLEDTILVLAAELPCLTPASLRSLLKNGRTRPHSLSEPGNGRARAVAARASDWKRALAGYPSVRSRDAIQRLSPRALLPREENELLLVDTTDSWAKALAVLRSRKIGDLLRKGVLVFDPASVFVEPEVQVGKGTILFPWVHLQGSTVVGRDSSIGSFSHIVDSSVGAGTAVLDHCFIRSSRIGKNVQIGPFAHLRPDSDVGAGAKVGNFVELKKTRLGAGAKAPHLSYLGDAVIGRGANVGAGTITCNYDGVRKHETIVGDGAFIGSDVQLVAPVRVGKGAYVAAGSCIVADVPPNALAIARSRQVVKLGWAKQRGPARLRKASAGRRRPEEAEAEGPSSPAQLRERAPRRGARALKK